MRPPIRSDPLFLRALRQRGVEREASSVEEEEEEVVVVWMLKNRQEVTLNVFTDCTGCGGLLQTRSTTEDETSGVWDELLVQQLDCVITSGVLNELSHLQAHPAPSQELYPHTSQK